MSKWIHIVELIKREVVKHKDGPDTIHYTTNKPGHKIVVKDGEPREEKMDHEERSMRSKTQVIGGNKQRGITKVNKDAEKKSKYSNKKVENEEK